MIVFYNRVRENMKRVSQDFYEKYKDRPPFLSRQN